MSEQDTNQESRDRTPDDRTPDDRTPDHRTPDHRTPDTDTEGSGTEQGLREYAGLHDEIARKGEDTAAFHQDASAAKRPDR
jgi:hypothetical protein